MAAVKETLVFVALFCYIFLVDFGSGRSTKELADLDKGVDRLHREFILRAWMQSAERKHSRRSKRRARFPKRKLKFHLPHFPLYPMDMPVCKDADRESKAGSCKSWANAGYCEEAKSVMKIYCPKECKYCKPFSPPGCTLSKYGCCWNNIPAHGENGHGCPRCMDSYKRLCRLFTLPGFNYCSKGGIEGRFIRYNCFQSCGWCDNFTQLTANQTRNV